MQKRYVSSIILLFIAIVIAAYQGVIAKPSIETEQEPPDVETYDFNPDEDDDETASLNTSTLVPLNTNAVVTNVVDGDTIDVTFDDGLEARVRLLGVNTPETVDPRKEAECFGAEASAFSKETLGFERVLLVADPQADERDKYGRLLRNIYLDDGTDFNALLIEQGFAYAYLSFPLDSERKAELKRLENEAKEAQRGLWAPGVCRGSE